MRSDGWFRLAILADIHANLPALEAVLQDAASLGVDSFIVAGDFAHGGPHPRQVLERLVEIGALLVKGNNEEYLIDYDSGHAPDWCRTALQWASVRWTVGQCTRAHLDLLATLPSQLVLNAPGQTAGRSAVRVVHGSPRRINEGLIPDQLPEILEQYRRASLLLAGWEERPLQSVMAEIAEPTLVCAHTHIQWQQRWDGHLVFNPGSAGSSGNGDPRAQYAILQWEGSGWQVYLRRVAYDLALLKSAYQTSGFLETGAYARGCLLDALSGSNRVWEFILYAMQTARQSGWDGQGGIPDDAWQQAEKTFPWDGLTSQTPVPGPPAQA